MMLARLFVNIEQSFVCKLT